MSSEQQPWWLPNPPRKPDEGRPGLGWIGGSLVVLLLAWPPLTLIALIVGPGRHGNWTVSLDPLTEAVRSQHFLATLTITCLAGIASCSCARLLCRGKDRRDLWRAVFCFWLLFPAQATAFCLLHWFMLWRDNVGIYDFWLRLQGIGNAALLAAIVSAYLLLSRRMRRRFSPAADLAAVF